MPQATSLLSSQAAPVTQPLLPVSCVSVWNHFMHILWGNIYFLVRRWWPSINTTWAFSRQCSISGGDCISAHELPSSVSMAPSHSLLWLGCDWSTQSSADRRWDGFSQHWVPCVLIILSLCPHMGSSLLQVPARRILIDASIVWAPGCLPSSPGGEVSQLCGWSDLLLFARVEIANLMTDGQGLFICCGGGTGWGGSCFFFSP